MLSKQDIEKYFIAEKQESLLFLGIGIVALITAICLLIFTKSNMWRGFAMPLILVGLIQFVVGYTVYNRSDADRTRVVYALDMNPDELKQKEMPRMEVVMKNFVVYRYVEIGLAIVGFVLFFMMKNNVAIENSWKGKSFWYGLGIALFIQSILMLGADYFAEKRGHVYNNLLKKTVQQKN